MLRTQVGRWTALRRRRPCSDQHAGTQIETDSLAATIGAVAILPAAAAAAPVPPGNSAATQYTEAFPTAGGQAESRERQGSQGREPSEVLGKDNAQRLESQGAAGEAAAAIAAETAPAGVSGEAGQGNGGGTGGDHDAAAAGRPGRQRNPAVGTAGPGSARLPRRPPAPRSQTAPTCCCRWPSWAAWSGCSSTCCDAGRGQPSSAARARQSAASPRGSRSSAGWRLPGARPAGASDVRRRRQGSSPSPGSPTSKRKCPSPSHAPGRPGRSSCAFPSTGARSRPAGRAGRLASGGPL